MREFALLAAKTGGLEELVEVFVENAEDPLAGELILIEHLSAEFAPLHVGRRHKIATTVRYSTRKVERGFGPNVTILKVIEWAIGPTELKLEGAPSDFDLKHDGKVEDLRNFHPAAREIFQRHPFEMAVYTNEDAWLWTSKLLDDARRAKNNAFYESTIRIANPVETVIQAFQCEGYAVDLHTLAVNSKLSIQGIYDRFESQLDFSAAPRWTGIEFHDAAYAAFPMNVGHLEATAGLERVAVYRRNGTNIYLNTQTATQNSGAEQAIVAERNHEWEPEAKREYLDKWNQLCSDIEARAGIKPEWYVENARRLRREAELFAVSRAAHGGERVVLSRIMGVTHHHVFMRSKADNELIRFDVSAIDAAKLPARNLRLMPQPQDSQP